MIAKAISIWLVLVVLAIANAGLRNTLITPRIGEHGGHIASTVIFCVVIFVVALRAIGWMGASTRRDAITIGALWLVMTVAFEFLAGHYVFGNTWEKLFADYNIFEGRVWIAVLVATFAAPWWAERQRGIRVAGNSKRC